MLLLADNLTLARGQRVLIRDLSLAARLWISARTSAPSMSASFQSPVITREIAIPGKELGKDDFTKIPNGLPGIEDRLPVMWTTGVSAGKITANQFVAYNSTNPARITKLRLRRFSSLSSGMGYCTRSIVR